jgi:hypothetical protein
VSEGGVRVGVGALDLCRIAIEEFPFPFGSQRLARDRRCPWLSHSTNSLSSPPRLELRSCRLPFVEALLMELQRLLLLFVLVRGMTSTTRNRRRRTSRQKEPRGTRHKTNRPLSFFFILSMLAFKSEHQAARSNAVAHWNLYVLFGVTIWNECLIAVHCKMYRCQKGRL